MNSFIYGKDTTQGITSVEVDGSVATIYTGDGKVTQRLNEFYIIYPQQVEEDLIALRGNLHYKYVKKFEDYKEYQTECSINRAKGIDYFTVYNPKESFMIKNGVSYYKGMKPKDVSVLSFDIETTGLNPNNNSVLIISNTFRINDKIERRLFAIDEFNNEQEMIYAWCNYVNDLDPNVILGHNILGFDLPFLKRRGQTLKLGKGKTDCIIAKKPSQFRKDGSQSYDYFNVLITGREVVDTFHLSIKYDVGRNYPSYKLKEIIKYEGLERADRQHYDAVNIKNALNNPPQWQKVKTYAEHDADDALALWDLMIPSYFYYAQSIPKTLQQIVNGATGSQVNSFMIRAYLSEYHSIPKASDAVQYEGAISYGNPGIYKYVGKVDVASLYPSIIIQEKIYDKSKDPKGYFLKMVEYFTAERLSNKRLAKETGDRYYKDIEQAQKIVINSAYGFLGAPGLNFNSPINAANVTRHGRTILQRGIEWARQKGWTIVNADTDSFCFTTSNKFPTGVFSTWIAELNTLFPEKIRWEDDGRYDSVIVVKAKNYVLRSAEDGKVKIKGSALKATMKEPALTKFIDDGIKLLLDGRPNDIRELYKGLVRDIHNINRDTIALWSSKKTVTKSVLQPKRTNESRIKDSIEQAKKVVQEGDKIFVFYRDEETLSICEAFDGTYSAKRLLGKLYNTIKVFETILSMDDFPNYTLKKNEKLLNSVLVNLECPVVKTHKEKYEALVF